MRFLVVSCGRNCESRVGPCLESIVSQRGHDFYAVIVDDASTDGTWEAVRLFIENDPLPLNSTGWTTLERRGAMANQWEAIDVGLESFDADAIVFLDLDDRFAHPDVLNRLAIEYQAGAAMTFGSYVPVPASATCPVTAPYPSVVARDGSHRAFMQARGGVLFNHCRSLAVSTWLQITPEDCQDDDGEWFMVSADFAVMVPALEVARDRCHFVPDVLVEYTSDAGNAEWRTAAAETNRVHKLILSRPPKQPVSAHARRVAQFEAIESRKRRKLEKANR